MFKKIKMFKSIKMKMESSSFVTIIFLFIIGALTTLAPIFIKNMHETLKDFIQTIGTSLLSVAIVSLFIEMSTLHNYSVEVCKKLIADEYLYDKIGKIVNGIEIINFAGAFQKVLENRTNVINLRIFAISTIKSAPIITSYQVNFDNVKVLLREYYEGDLYRDLSLEKRINDTIKDWKRASKIKNLEIRRFNYNPDSGYFIVDNEFLIIGQYVF